MNSDTVICSNRYYSIWFDIGYQICESKKIYIYTLPVNYKMVEYYYTI